jgi:hypothetical protein
LWRFAKGICSANGLWAALLKRLLAALSERLDDLGVDRAPDERLA